MQDFYEPTALTPMRVARLSGYIEWASQPKMFKHYPEFLFRYAFGTNKALKVLELSRTITSRTNIGGKPYNQLNTPSAGNLHPIELYVQIRAVKGLINGIYHVDAQSESIVLIREIEQDGLESAVGMKSRFKGMLFLVSCVPFRSEWKYKERAIRYCYLDAGHQIGAIQASLTLHEQSMTILSLPDTVSLNTLMGFREDEFTCCVIAVGEQTDKSVEELKTPLMYVAPTDYCEINGFIQNLMHEEEAFSSVAPLEFEVDENMIMSRRSARQFGNDLLQNDVYEYFMHMIKSAPKILSFNIINLEDDVVRNRVSSLLIEQSFVKSAAFVCVMSAKRFGSNELMSAGALAHQLHMYAQKMKVGFSGVGAFYDKKLQAYLQTKEYILYVCVVGTHKK